MAVSRQSQGVPTTIAILRLRIVGTKSKHFGAARAAQRMRRDFVPKSCGYTRFTHVSLGLGDPRVRVWGCGCVGDWTCAWLKTSREQARGARNRSRPDLGR